MQAIRNVRVYDKKEEIQMKRKLTALLLTLCMIASLLPGTLTAEAAAANRFQVRYDAFRGSVFWSKGDAAPQLNVEDYLGSEDWTGYVNQTNPVHFLLDPTQAPDQALWDSERTLELHPVETDADTAVYVRVSYDTEDGWYSAEAVLADQAQPGYTFENQVLSFTPANARGEVFLEVWWSGADYAFQSFVPEEGEIMVDYRWDGEQPILAQENAVIRQLLQPEHCRRRAAFPADTPSLDFSWSGHVERLWGDNVLHDGDWGELPEPEGNSFTLYLDQADRELYSLGFSFALDWNYRFGVNYDMNGGLVFQSVGESLPLAQPSCFLPSQGAGREGWPDDPSFEGPEGPAPIHLLFDESRAVDWNAWEDGTLRFTESWQSEDRAISVVARYHDAAHVWQERTLVEKGVPASGVSFADGLLRFTPPSGYGVDFDVFWTRQDYDFSLFRPTEEKPVMVEINWWGDNEPVLQDDVPQEDVLTAPGRMRLRLPLQTESLSFFWEEFPPLRQINVNGLGEDGGWLNGIETQDNYYTLELNQSWDNGEPRDWYHIQFEFENFPMEDNGAMWVNYRSGRGALFLDFGEDAFPPAQPAYYWHSGEEGRVVYPFNEENCCNESVRIRLDETQAIDWDRWEQSGEVVLREAEQLNDRQLFVELRSNWGEGLVVSWGNLTELGERKGFRLLADDQSGERLLGFAPYPNGSDIELSVYWTLEEWQFDHFRGTEEAPVVVQVDWWGSGSVVLPQEVGPKNMLLLENQAKLRVPLDTESLSFTWEGDAPLRQINVEGLGEDGGWLNGVVPEGGSYTLELDQSWDNGQPRDWYHIQFEFENEGGGNTAAFYEQGYGSVFWALGQELPVADAAHYLGFGFENGFSFRPTGTPQPIHLLFDGSIGLDYEAYFQGELRFVDSPVPAEKRIVGVYADSDWCSGPIFWGGSVTENGAAQGVSYEGGILTIQPGYSGDLILHIYWTQADADFDGFQGSEACPVIVEYSWRNYGEIPVPEGIPAENALVHADGGRARLRLPLDTEAVTFTWAEEYGVREISHSVRTPEGEWWESIPVDQSEPHSFTLSLDQTEERDGSLLPVTWYQVDFDFFEDSRWQLWVDWTASEGNLFFGLDAAPPLDETHYIQQPPSFRAEDENGEPCIGEVCLTLDPTHSVSYFGEGIEFWALPEYDYDPFIFVEYPHADGSWFEAMVVEHGAAVQPGFRFEENTLRFTPENEKPVMVHVFWNQADMAYRGFESTEERPVLVELMLGARARVSLPGDIPQEDLLLWHAAEHDYVKLRLPADRESLELRWAREGIIGLLEVQGAGPEGSTLTLSPPRGCSYLLELNQSEGGQPRDYYHLSFWEFNWPDNPFRDVANTAWYREAVLFALVSGITAGSSADTFSPNRAVTRSQMLTFLWRAADSPAPESELCPFTDVPENAWYRDAVLWAAESGVSVGTGGGAFSPAAGCSRAEALTFLWRAAGSPAPEGTDCPFTDVPEDAWYRDAVLWAVERGITAGSSETSFSPAKGCTRAQAVTFLFRAILYG